jgi:N utilization substance protein B
VAGRRRSRRAAHQALYAADVAARSGRPEAASDALAGVAAHFDLHETARAFADEIVRGVEANREALDARIAAHARNWRVERMAAVDRNVLRIATWELVCTDTPGSVVIDEAIEIARDFGGERSPAFVNGVLDAIARGLEAERGGVPAGAEP